jgi:hypothetical protein
MPSLVDLCASQAGLLQGLAALFQQVLAHRFTQPLLASAVRPPACLYACMRLPACLLPCLPTELLGPPF